ncbi:hypothetical protein NPIL_609381 [Nephila pilipes]|uniref:Uncharacterized protein n=1 Tax=Nephila pilipes TaxID=299642 RepID=A0A8X6IB61_NEPPI|nr:hypothetical protein NPIL_609381 [Nephila pilipes]
MEKNQDSSNEKELRNENRDGLDDDPRNGESRCLTLQKWLNGLGGLPTESAKNTEVASKWAYHILTEGMKKLSVRDTSHDC